MIKLMTMTYLKGSVRERRERIPIAGSLLKWLQQPKPRVLSPSGVRVLDLTHPPGALAGSSQNSNRQPCEMSASQVAA